MRATICMLDDDSMKHVLMMIAYKCTTVDAIRRHRRIPFPPQPLRDRWKDTKSLEEYERLLRCYACSPHLGQDLTLLNLLPAVAEHGSLTDTTIGRQSTWLNAASASHTAWSTVTPDDPQLMMQMFLPVDADERAAAARRAFELPDVRTATGQLKDVRLGTRLHFEVIQRMQREITYLRLVCRAWNEFFKSFSFQMKLDAKFTESADDVMGSDALRGAPALPVHVKDSLMLVSLVCSRKAVTMPTPGQHTFQIVDEWIPVSAMFKQNVFDDPSEVKDAVRLTMEFGEGERCTTQVSVPNSMLRSTPVVGSKCSAIKWRNRSLSDFANLPMDAPGACYTLVSTMSREIRNSFTSLARVTEPIRQAVFPYMASYADKELIVLYTQPPKIGEVPTDAAKDIPRVNLVLPVKLQSTSLDVTDTGELLRSVKIRCDLGEIRTRAARPCAHPHELVGVSDASTFSTYKTALSEPFYIASKKMNQQNVLSRKRDTAEKRRKRKAHG